MDGLTSTVRADTVEGTFEKAVMGARGIPWGSQ